MYTNTEKTQENTPLPAANSASKQQSGKPILQLADNRVESAAQRKMQQDISNSPRVLQMKGKVPANADVAQLVKIEQKGINGLTHLVEMTEDGRLYTGGNWLENEREEVKAGDLLEVDVDDTWRSHRGMNQERNWKTDSENDQPHLWVRALKLNHKPLAKGRYVRNEMLTEGHEEIPKKIHSVWVQGDYQQNPEAMEGLKARQDEHLEGWVNIIWLYDTGRQSHGFAPQLQKKPVKIDTGGFVEVFERSFVDEMNTWKKSGNMPEWVNAWLPILQVLRHKKSFITMSDIMRMIILYYEGGVYMDVKIKVNPGHADFKSKPMLLINTANFYSAENWAIMANAGCRMIEEIMIQALHQFPGPGRLNEYPENYQREQGVEGKMHVELHERKGVWNIIEKYRTKHSYRIPLALTNPRPINSWANAYDDRHKDVIRKEQEQFRLESINECQRKLAQKERERSQLEEEFRYAKFENLWPSLRLTKEIVAALPGTIRNLSDGIDLLKAELHYLQNSGIDDEQSSDNTNFEAQLAALNSLK